MKTPFCELIMMKLVTDIANQSKWNQLPVPKSVIDISM